MLRAAVIGAGLMGRRLALVAARAGADVSLYDANATVLDQARSAVASEAPQVRICASLADAVRDADFLTEAIVENLQVKQALFAEMSALNPDCILATNTSVLPVSRIAENVQNPERVVGTHWWNPPDLIPVVEVVRGKMTSDDVMSRTIEILRSWGKTPVRVEKDVPGFVGNRLQHALWREAIAMVAEGVCDAETVDLMARNTLGLRLGAMGPIENADYVGLDLTLAIHDAVLPSLNRDQHPSSLLSDMVADGKLGAKSGQGFLAWPQGARDEAATRLAGHIRQQLDRLNTKLPAQD